MCIPFSHSNTTSNYYISTIKENLQHQHYFLYTTQIYISVTKIQMLIFL